MEASDRILVLRRGELIEQGTHHELRARGGLMPSSLSCRRVGATVISSSLPIPAEPLLQQYGQGARLCLR